MTTEETTFFSNKIDFKTKINQLDTDFDKKTEANIGRLKKVTNPIINLVNTYYTIQKDIKPEDFSIELNNKIADYVNILKSAFVKDAINVIKPLVNQIQKALDTNNYLAPEESDKVKDLLNRIIATISKTQNSKYSLDIDEELDNDWDE